MTPREIIERRLELGLTTDELAFALNVTEEEMLRIEAGKSEYCHTPAFEEAFAILEERVAAMFAGA